jgi:hypothetical protein
MRVPKVYGLPRKMTGPFEEYSLLAESPRLNVPEAVEYREHLAIL